LNFYRKDTLQRRYLRTLTRRAIDPPTHYVPSSAAFTQSVRTGLGWGLVPEQDIRDDESDTSDGLVRLGDRHLDIPLFWQHWRLESALLQTLTREVLAAAGRALR
ncbi:MAG: ArgP/LysG family DNA-binding transcriptional regulator, partial [Nocardioidaceae bacterium]